MSYYLLNEYNIPVSVDYNEYLKFYKSCKDVKHEMIDKYYLSTIFLGECISDKYFFETILFDENMDIKFVIHYKTYNDSLKGHNYIKDYLEK